MGEAEAGSNQDPEAHVRARDALAALGTTSVRLELPDVDGVLRGKRYGVEHFLDILATGSVPWSQAVFCWDVAGHVYGNLPSEPWQSGFFGDIFAVPDLSTLAPVPWEPGTAAVLVDCVDVEGRDVEVSPRFVLRQVAAQLAARDLQVRAAVEYEFVLLRETSASAAWKRFTDLSPADPGTLAYSLLRVSDLLPVLEDLSELCNAAGIPLDVLHTEPGPGMVEANLHHLPLLEAADAAIRFKLAAKQIAKRHGLLATFMAKWSNAEDGCGAHLHQSLWDLRGRPVSAGRGGRGFSARFRSYLAGQVATMAGCSALFNPTVNSYRRVASTPAAPRNVSWGVQNRLAAIRLLPGEPGATRLEHRRSGADSNPYLALAGSVAGGLHGLDQRLRPPPPVVGNAYEASPEVAAALPTNLAGATDLLRRSAVARRYLGDAFVDHFVASREWELAEFDRSVTDWEVRRYLEQI